MNSYAVEFLYITPKALSQPKWIFGILDKLDETLNFELLNEIFKVILNCHRLHAKLPAKLCFM